MNDTITTEPITTQQLRALRHADTVVFSARSSRSITTGMATSSPSTSTSTASP